MRGSIFKLSNNDRRNGGPQDLCEGNSDLWKIFLCILVITVIFCWSLGVLLKRPTNHARNNGVRKDCWNNLEITEVSLGSEKLLKHPTNHARNYGLLKVLLKYSSNHKSITGLWKYFRNILSPKYYWSLNNTFQTF